MGGLSKSFSAHRKGWTFNLPHPGWPVTYCWWGCSTIAPYPPWWTLHPHVICSLSIVCTTIVYLPPLVMNVLCLYLCYHNTYEMCFWHCNANRTPQRSWPDSSHSRVAAGGTRLRSTCEGSEWRFSRWCQLSWGSSESPAESLKCRTPHGCAWPSFWV